MSTGDLSVDTADVVTLAGRTEAVSDAVSEGISALNAAPSSDGFGMIVGAIIGPVLRLLMICLLQLVLMRPILAGRSGVLPRVLRRRSLTLQTR